MLNELLHGKDTSQVLDRSAIFGMSTFELILRGLVSGDPSDVGNTDNVAVQVGLKNTFCSRLGMSWKSLLP